MQDDPSVIVPALQAVRQGFASHKTQEYSYRVSQLRALQRGIRDSSQQIIQALDKDLHRCEFLTRLTEIDHMCGYVDYCIRHLKTWMQPEHCDIEMVSGPGSAYIVRQPFGVALVVGAWNFPFSTTISPLICAIAAGNAALIKPSEMSAASSQVIYDICQSLDQSVYRCIQGGVQVAIAIFQQRYDLIIFTGSPMKGKLVAQAAAVHMTPTILELGGKNPTIIDEDVDMDVACMRIIQGKCLNAGQICLSPDYVLIQEKQLQHFIARYKHYVTQFYGEDPSKSADFGRIVNEMHTKRIASYLENHSGSVALGGRSNVQERYIEPTIVVNPSLDSALANEEIFGPVLVVFTIKDIDEAIEFINAREKPLAIYYYGNVTRNHEKIAKQTSSGNFSVNESVFNYTCKDLPFGGVGGSGMGVYHSKYGFLSMSHNRSYLVKSSANGFPTNLRYPPHTPAKIGRVAFMSRITNFTMDQAKRTVKQAVIVAALAVAYKLGYFDSFISGVVSLASGILPKL
jgi:aldehyde dehydrogenase (NAD+)